MKKIILILNHHQGIRQLRVRSFKMIRQLCFSILCCLTIAHGQRPPNRGHREYGMGIATTKSPYTVPLSFNERPFPASLKVAYFHNDTLVFLKAMDTVRSFDRMVEIGYDEIGFPILGYSSDSQWVKVSLDCHAVKNPPVGWLQRNTKDLTIRSWTDVLSKENVFHFINAERRSFYSRPSAEALIRPKLYEQNSRASYNMYRGQIKGRWMQVELETPSSFCRSDEENLQEFGVLPKKQTVWIQFLDARLRPLIFFSTRGC